VKKEKKKVSKISKNQVFNIIFWIVIIGLFIIWITDFIMVKTEKDPVFCISRETYKYDDGETKECVGLGYKIFEYNRDKYQGYEFGPFFTKIKK